MDIMILEPVVSLLLESCFMIYRLYVYMYSLSYVSLIFLDVWLVPFFSVRLSVFPFSGPVLKVFYK